LAKELLAITRKANVPLLINDRIDVALAVGADGVHIGQSDMPLEIARKLMGDKIIGVTVGTAEQAKIAIQGGADYLGIGACFDTSTKALTKIPFGPLGLRHILEELQVGIPCVTIGGIKSTNAERVIQLSKGSEGRSVSGVAVVSDIIAAKDVPLATRTLKQVVERGLSITMNRIELVEDVTSKVAELLELVRAKTPLVHHITNFVVMNDSANATLAVGASPIMAQCQEEAADLGKVIGSLLMNIGTLNPEFISGMFAAGKNANTFGLPIILDPVGAGASELRETTMRSLVQKVKFDVIKGNAGEIAALVKSNEVQMKGVDSVGSLDNGAEFVKKAALSQSIFN
jgi:thiamine-phosphate diphosphorylase/hydroxyethylthiazole kinase